MKEYRSRKKQNYGTFLFLYTGVFLLMALVLFRPFKAGGRSMIWDYDGLYQAYAAMVYYSGYWRELFRNLLVEHRFELPMTDPGIGLGFDIFTTLNHYGFGDPLSAVAVFFKPEQMEACYNFLAVLRFYLSGLSFSAYCFYMRRNVAAAAGEGGRPEAAKDREGQHGMLPVLAGALAYGFCSFALYAGVRHPYFLNSMIYFPLFLVGAERILKKRGGLLLSVMVGTAACSNFYFLYMLTLLTFLYALVRFVDLYGGQWKQQIRTVLLRGMGYYFLGIGLGAVLLLPNILAFLGNARSGISSGGGVSLLFYEPEVYKNFLGGIFFPEFGADFWVILGYGPLVLLGLVILWRAKERKTRYIRWYFTVLSLILLVPAGGLVMNGFSYVSHRWMYGYSFLCALILAYGVEMLPRIGRFQSRWFVGLAVAVCTGSMAIRIGMGVSEAADQGTEAAIAAVGVVKDMVPALILFVCLMLLVFYARQNQRDAACARICRICAVVICCVSVMSFGTNLYGSAHENYVSEFQLSGSALDIFTQVSEVSSAEMEDGGFYRTEGDTEGVSNYGMVSGMRGTNGFFSIVPHEVYEYNFYLESADAKFPNWFYGLGDRAALMSLGSVKYFTRMEGSDMPVPYGYENVAKIRGVSADGSPRAVDIYESPYAMPLGYTYDSVLAESEYKELSALKKQQVMMQAVVLGGVEESSGRLESEPLEYVHWKPETKLKLDNAKWNQETGELQIGEGGGSICLEFQGAEDCETYVRMVGYDTRHSGYELTTFFVGNGNGYEKKIYSTSERSVWDGGFKNFIVRVSDSSQPVTGAYVRFPFAGSFRLDDVEIYHMPMDAFQKHAQERMETVLEDVRVESNRMSGSIVSQGSRMLCISMPYSKGWQAYVDGAETAVYKANGMYMAIMIPDGEHEVEFRYRTPGLLAGAVISFISLIGILAVYWKRKKKA